MIKKIESYYLLPDIDPKVLIKYGFERFETNYSKNFIHKNVDIRYYNDTRRFVYVDYPWKDARGKKVKDYLNELVEDGIVELRTNYEWWAIIGRWQDYPQKKKDRIQAKLDKLDMNAKSKVNPLWYLKKGHAYLLKRNHKIIAVFVYKHSWQKRKCKKCDEIYNLTLMFEDREYKQYEPNNKRNS